MRFSTRPNNVNVPRRPGPHGGYHYDAWPAPAERLHGQGHRSLVAVDFRWREIPRVLALLEMRFADTKCSNAYGIIQSYIRTEAATGRSA